MANSSEARDASLLLITKSYPTSLSCLLQLKVAGRGCAPAHDPGLARTHVDRADEHLSRRHHEDPVRCHEAIRRAPRRLARTCKKCRDRGAKVAVNGRRARQKTQENRRRPSLVYHVAVIHTAGVSGSNPLAPTTLRLERTPLAAHRLASTRARPPPLLTRAICVSPAAGAPVDRRTGDLSGQSGAWVAGAAVPHTHARRCQARAR